MADDKKSKSVKAAKGSPQRASSGEDSPGPDGKAPSAQASGRTASGRRASGAVEAQLKRYREMRDFSVTSEPAGSASAKAGQKLEPSPAPQPGGPLPFVVQKHAATRLHYDFRLGLHGVLKSWAVTKGPSYFTGDKRLAVQVEDHPMEYGGFEGTIPKGQYGGGTVMLWDEGTWEPQGDPDEGLAKGNLKFVLHGTKLKGKWVLVRMGDRAGQEGKPNWLLIKEHDEYQRGAIDPVITEEAPDSVITGRNLEAIARSGDHVWNSNREPQQDTKRQPRPVAKAAGNEAAPATFEVPKAAPKERLPNFIAPQLASQATEPPSSSHWVHELKLDGYRVQAHLAQSAGKSPLKVALYTRKGLDWTARMPSVAADLSHLPVESAILDGEVVVLDDKGLSSFAELQAAFQDGEQKHMVYFAFDLLHLNGRNLRDQPLRHRKDLLRKVIDEASFAESVHYSEDIEGHGAEMFSEACRAGAEGVISKRESAPYISGRGASWVKVKCVRAQEFVIGGFTLPSNGSAGVGALLLGYYEEGKLLYAGRTGTGFTHKTSVILRKELEMKKQAKTPFDKPPADARRDALWVSPVKVAEVQFRTWTADGLVRQASFKGLREDKPAKEVVKETATVTLNTDKTAASGENVTSIVTNIKDPDSGAPQEDASPASRGKKAPRPGKKGGKGTVDASSEPDAIQPDAPANPALKLPVRLTHPEKVLDPESKLSKQQLAEYYLQIAPHMLPHIEGRPVSIIRCPEAIGQQCFFQRHLNRSLPKGVEGIAIKEKNGSKIEEFITLSTVEALVGLGQMNVLELHPWGSRNDDIERPDRLIFDLDPDEGISWRTLADAALEVHARLTRWGLKSFLKTTGGKGLHVVAPIDADLEWPVVKDFAHAFVQQMEQDNTRLYLTKMTKAARKGKIYLDYLRNERGATAVAPFSPRARPGSYVSLPMEWKELEAKSAPRCSAATFAEWKDRLRSDPWKNMASVRQSLRPEEMRTTE